MTIDSRARDEIRRKLVKYISDTFVSSAEMTTLGGDASLLEEGVMDSTSVIDLVMFIEETFGIEVKDEELVPENLDSVNKIVAFVERKTRRRA